MIRRLLGGGALTGCLLVVFLCSSAQAIGLPIVLDGNFDDWATAPVVATDTGGDAGGGGIDFGRVWVADDENYLYLRFETGIEVQGDEGQDLRLYMDTDLDAGTGTRFGGIGADLVWNFGFRDGDFRGTNLNHDDVGLLLGPTVSSTEFEIALRLDAVPNGSDPLFPQPAVRFILSDGSGGDRLPDSGSIAYVISGQPQGQPSIGFDRFDPTHVRVASYNVLSDGIFDPGATEAAYRRILGVIDADVWIFCEVWNHNAQETAARLEQLLPAGPGKTWDAVKLDSGNVIVSRYPIIGSWEVLPGSRLTAARIDLSPDQDRDLLAIACHLSCCTADQNRQEQADALVAFLRDARTPGGQIDLPQDTPIVAGGDFNLVGLRQQLDTILTGNIIDEGTFGPDSPPDWDGSDFDLPATTHTDLRVGYTWRRDTSSFYPGLLDFLFVTGSVVDLGNHYILDTRTMTSASLAASGLQVGDTESASDHDPRVLDLVYQVGTDAPAFARGDLQWLQNVPNPFNPRTELRFRLETAQPRVELSIYDVQGRRVRHFVREDLEAGDHAVLWDGLDASGRAVASGVYAVELRAGGARVGSKITLVR